MLARGDVCLVLFSNLENMSESRKSWAPKALALRVWTLPGRASASLLCPARKLAISALDEVPAGGKHKHIESISFMRGHWTRLACSLPSSHHPNVTWNPLKIGRTEAFHGPGEAHSSPPTINPSTYPSILTCASGFSLCSMSSNRPPLRGKGSITQISPLPI